MRRLAESSSVRSSHWVDGGHGRVLRVGDHIARERADALAAHGIALVRHGGRADLLFLERLFDLPVMLQQADIRAQCGTRSGRWRTATFRMRLSSFRGIGLAADGIAGGQSRTPPRSAGSSRRSFAPSPSNSSTKLASVPVVPRQPRKRMARSVILQLLKIQHQILQPERRALADGRQLRGLVVRIAKRRHGGILDLRTRRGSAWRPLARFRR